MECRSKLLRIRQHKHISRIYESFKLCGKKQPVIAAMRLLLEDSQ